MSLTVYIDFDKPKNINYDDCQVACGSNIIISKSDEPEDYWSANITHNMGKMAENIPVEYKHQDGEEYENTLYAVVWHPEDYNIDSTDVISDALAHGIAYMVLHRNELLKYNPENGWGNYDAFLQWLIVYKKMCDKNPGCKISVSR